MYISTIEATDGIDLAYHAFMPKQKFKSTLIFYHGGGANSLAGYTKFANQLCKQFGVAVYLFDIRGHGNSAGQRGHSPTVTQIWQDISTAIEFVRSQFPKIKIYLGGHSSGAGLILNYSSYASRKDISGYIMIAPEFGPRAKFISQSNHFAAVRFLPILLHSLSSGLICGACKAVTFSYSEEEISKYNLLKFYTVNMAKSATPMQPKRMLEKIDKETHIFISDHDKLINAKDLTKFLQPTMSKNSNISLHITNKGGHLSICNTIFKQVGPILQ